MHGNKLGISNGAMYHTYSTQNLGLKAIYSRPRRRTAHDLFIRLCYDPSSLAHNTAFSIVFGIFPSIHAIRSPPSVPSTQSIANAQYPGFEYNGGFSHRSPADLQQGNICVLRSAFIPNTIIPMASTLASIDTNANQEQQRTNIPPAPGPPPNRPLPELPRLQDMPDESSSAVRPKTSHLVHSLMIVFKISQKNTLL